MAAKKAVDVEAVRSATTGRWPEILQNAGGIDPAILDGQHHPCPRCGGTDRFRLIDKEAGAVLCNQCFSENNGDGFSAIGWMLDLDFIGAVSRVGEYLGIAQTNGKKRKAAKKTEPVVDPAKDLDFKPWSSSVAAILCGKKPGLTEAAMIACGARYAMYKRNIAVFAFPVIGPTLDASAPVGWVLIGALGNPIPVWDQSGKITEYKKVKVTYGSEPGFLGVHGVERLKLPGLVDRAWKVEGITDLIALVAAIPPSKADRHVAVTNSNGAKQCPQWMAELLATCPTVAVVGDADMPGQVGAKKWCEAISLAGGPSRNVVLPGFDIAEDHGRDVRDWLTNGNDYADLCVAADAAYVIQAKTEGAAPDPNAPSHAFEREILRRLQIEVLYESEDGSIRIFSYLLRKSSRLPGGAIDRLGKSRLIQICGAAALNAVSAEPDNETTFAINDIRNAIALIASERRESHNERGVGIWRGRDDDGNETDSLVLIGDTEVARWTPEAGLEKVFSPRTDGIVLDLGAGQKNWFMFDELKRYCEQAADPAWCREVINHARDLFGRWRWKNPDSDPELITGLVLASWVQTIWDWRPLVAIDGSTSVGKSIFFECLAGRESRRGIYGNLCFSTTKGTEPGIRQGIGNTAKVMLCDEFEDSKQREAILELLRGSSRGAVVSRGSSDQKGRTFSLRHLGWVAATETGLKRQPDLNRFIRFALEPTHKAKVQLEQFTIPGSDTLQRLGQKMLAISIVGVLPAVRMAEQLKNTIVPGVSQRTVESYAAPASILAVGLGYDRERATKLLASLLAPVDLIEQSTRDDEELLSEILSGTIYCGKDGNLSVGAIIDSTSLWGEHAGKVNSAGIDIENQPGTIGPQTLYVAYTIIGKKLLRGTQWEGKRLDTLLLRLPGAAKDRRRISGQRPHVISIPLPDVSQPETNPGF